MMGRDYVERLFHDTSQSADISIIEGVMGLFDGADPDTIDGSSAEIAIWLKAPVILVVNVHGVARSLAAIVKGFSEFHPDLNISGIFANHCGSPRHGQWLARALEASSLPEMLGAIPRGALPELPSRHLGLVSADSELLNDQVLSDLEKAGEEHLNIDGILDLALSSAPLGSPGRARPQVRERRGSEAVRIGVAMDEAFHFYYPDNLQALEEAGARIIHFSPIHDKRLPDRLEGLYLGGGYPEVYAGALSANSFMLQAIRDFSESGAPVYGECGGLMYMSEAIETPDGKTTPMVGLLPARTFMLDRLQSLGYVEVVLTEDSLFGKRGATIRGHEFHYSKLMGDGQAPPGWKTIYSIKKRPGKTEMMEGYQKGNILLSYAHLHFSSSTGAAEHFVDLCGAKRPGVSSE
jgi:cobyrinic acid a,c-diamide synthase